MRLIVFLLSLPLAAQQEQLNQLAKTFNNLTFYSATFISSQPTDVSIDGVPQRLVVHRKVLVNGRNKRMDVVFNPTTRAPMNVRIIIVNGDHSWELTPAAKLVYERRSPQLEREPYEAVPLRLASQVKDAHFAPDETIRLEEGPPHRCQVIKGRLEMAGPLKDRLVEYPVTYWIDRQTGLPVQAVQGDHILQIVSFTPNDTAALDESRYVYTAQPDWKVLEPR